jgi:hypothetical protein
VLSGSLLRGPPRRAPQDEVRFWKETDFSVGLSGCGGV